MEKCSHQCSVHEEKEEKQRERRKQKDEIVILFKFNLITHDFVFEMKWKFHVTLYFIPFFLLSHFIFLFFPSSDKTRIKVIRIYPSMIMLWIKRMKSEIYQITETYTIHKHYTQTLHEFICALFSFFFRMKIFSMKRQKLIGPYDQTFYEQLLSFRLLKPLSLVTQKSNVIKA